jgi:hypothetical protein
MHHDTRIPRTTLLTALTLVSLSFGSAARADDTPLPLIAPGEEVPHGAQLDLVGGVAALGAPGELGLAFVLGTRLALGRYTALRFDIGYGVMGGARSLEDRWWLVPSFAVVAPFDDARVELGLGLGFATSSGYSSFEAFVREPFEDDWAYQLVPAVRGHLALWLELGADVDAYLQLDAGGLVTQGNDVGLRVGPDDGRLAPNDAQLTWATITVGTSHRLL